MKTCVIWGPSNTGLVLPSAGLRPAIAGSYVTRAQDVSFTPSGAFTATNVQAAILEAASTSFASGTNAAMMALTPANGTSYYNTTYQTMFVYTNNRWFPRNIDPRYGFYLFDEFLQTSTAFSLNWSISATVTTFAATATNPGFALIRQATASARASIQLQNTGTVISTSMDSYQEWLVRFPTLATGAEDFSAAIGYNDGAAYASGSLGVDNICFVYNRGSSLNWIMNCTSNSVATSTATSTPVAANTLYLLGIRVTADTSVDFLINGTVVGTITTNIPSAAARATGYQARVDKILGTANADLHIDYFMTYGFFTAARA